MVSGVFSPRGGNYVVAVEGLDEINFADAKPKLLRLAAQAVNRTARKYRTESSRAIREQIAFPARFLDSRDDGRLRVSRFAKPSSLSAAITGRGRATSLARFVKGPRTKARKAPTVEVSPGNREKLNRAFLMGLKNANIGLAVRLREGERIENKRKMVQVSGSLYLLYGPSVDQVFRSVAEDVSDDAGDFLEQEFLRLTEAFL